MSTASSTASRAAGFDTPTGGSVFTPVRVLSAAAIVLALFILLAPQEREDVGAAYSSYAVGAGGARALYETLGRLGFAVSRNETSLASAPISDSTSAYALIQPAQPLTTIEQTQLLEAVRRGLVLIFTPDDDELADSLGFELRSSPGGFYTLSRTTVAGGNPPAPPTQDPRAAFQEAFPISVTVASKSKSDNQTFLWLQSLSAVDQAISDSARRPALVLGHRFGRGYVIAVAPAQILMNQVMRQPRAAIAVVRALQFANGSAPSARSPRVVFDEYHHGFGVHADMPAAVVHALTDTPPGRVALEITVAALVLLMAFAVRPLAPVSIPPISRRSPLEHVGALAHAYSQVDARSLGTSMLVRGLRRRHSLGLPRSASNTTYLSALRDRLPAVSADVDRIASALAPDSPNSSDHFATTGAAVANIERAFRE
jgi:hypothetical protein